MSPSTDSPASSWAPTSTIARSAGSQAPSHAGPSRKTSAAQAEPEREARAARRQQPGELATEAHRQLGRARMPRPAGTPAAAPARSREAQGPRDQRCRARRAAAVEHARERGEIDGERRLVARRSVMLVALWHQRTRGTNCGVQAALHGAARDAENLGDLGFALVLVVAEHEHLAQPLGQRVEPARELRIGRQRGRLRGASFRSSASRRAARRARAVGRRAAASGRGTGCSRSGTARSRSGGCGRSGRARGPRGSSSPGTGRRRRRPPAATGRRRADRASDRSGPRAPAGHPPGRAPSGPRPSPRARRYRTPLAEPPPRSVGTTALAADRFMRRSRPARLQHAPSAAELGGRLGRTAGAGRGRRSRGRARRPRPCAGSAAA